MSVHRQQDRPGVNRSDQEAFGGARASVPNLSPLDAEHAHEFGRDLDATAVAALNRRVLVSFRDDLELILIQAARRFVEQTLTEALPAVWLRRAETFEAVGTESADEAAKACRRQAWVLATIGTPEGVA